MRHFGVPTVEECRSSPHHMRKRKSRELDQTRLVRGVDRMLRGAVRRRHRAGAGQPPIPKPNCPRHSRCRRTRQPDPLLRMRRLAVRQGPRASAACCAGPALPARDAICIGGRRSATSKRRARQGIDLRRRHLGLRARRTSTDRAARRRWCSARSTRSSSGSLRHNHPQTVACRTTSHGKRFTALCRAIQWDMNDGHRDAAGADVFRRRDDPQQPAPAVSDLSQRHRSLRHARSRRGDRADLRPAWLGRHVAQRHLPLRALSFDDPRGARASRAAARACGSAAPRARRSISVPATSRCCRPAPAINACGRRPS